MIQDQGHGNQKSELPAESSASQSGSQPEFPCETFKSLTHASNQADRTGPIIHRSSFIMHPVHTVRRVFMKDDPDDRGYDDYAIPSAWPIREQWDELVSAIEQAGGDVRTVNGGLNMAPCACCIQDSIVLFKDQQGRQIMLLCSPRPHERREEPDRIAERLQRIMQIDQVCRAPDSVYLEGGDLILIGTTYFVSIDVNGEGRTNQAGYDFFCEQAEPLGYSVVPVEIKTGFSTCVHLTSGASWAGIIPAGPDGGSHAVVLNPEWIDAKPFLDNGVIVLEIPNSEPQQFSANVLPVNDSLIVQADPRQEDLLPMPGLLAELQKTGFDCSKLIPVRWDHMNERRIGFTCCCLNGNQVNLIE